MARRQIAVNPSGRGLSQWRQSAFAVIPGWSEGPDPESRDSGFAAPRRPGTTGQSGIQPGRFGALAAEVGGSQIVRAQVGQFAFQALDVEPERPAMAEH